jgi:hypothetical protein
VAGDNNGLRLARQTLPSFEMNGKDMKETTEHTLYGFPG